MQTGIFYEIDAKAEAEDTDSEEYCENSLENVMSAIGMNKIRSQTQLTGNGVNIGIMDVSKVLSNSEISSTKIHYISPVKDLSDSDSNYYHGTHVGKIAAGNNGVAPNAEIYSTVGDDDYKTALTNLIDSNVDVVNMSMRLSRNSDYSDSEKYYTPDEKYFDFIISNKRISIVKSTGNNYGDITSPGLSYNIITVGGYFCNGTSDYSDDFMYGNSNYNHHSGCYKPDFIASQVGFNGSSPQTGGTGTSFAAPVATGTVALLFELCPVLKTQPEAVKAILMSSCHRKVTPAGSDPVETMSSGITNHQGAGAIDPYIAIAIAASNNYGVRTLEENATSESIKFVQPSYGSTGLNVSLAWSVNNPNTSTAGDKIRLQLTLRRNDVPIATSNLSNSSTQMVCVTPSGTQKNYTIQIDKHALNVEQKRIRYAYAFSVNKCKYEKTNKSKAAEGIFLLKNKSTGKYLTISNSILSQNSYSSSNSQYWILCDNRVASVSEDNRKLNIGSTINSNNKYVTLGISGSQAKIVRVADTTVTSGGNTSYYPKGTFCIVNNGYALANYDDSQVSWRTYNSANVLELLQNDFRL